jgi:NAD(P)-dependent dehydrogenase (short-subunit alcohol dehydrogenase family)
MSVVVTGASTGIGAACALDCAGRGMTVFAGVRDPRAGEALAAKGGPSLIPITLDVTDEPSIMRSVEVVQLVVGEGGLGGLVNNAGIVIGSPLEMIPLSQLRKQLEVNVIGQIAVTQAFLPLLAVVGRVNMVDCRSRYSIGSPILHRSLPWRRSRC